MKEDDNSHLAASAIMIKITSSTSHDFWVIVQASPSAKEKTMGKKHTGCCLVKLIMTPFEGISTISNFLENIGRKPHRDPVDHDPAYQMNMVIWALLQL